MVGVAIKLQDKFSGERQEQRSDTMSLHDMKSHAGHVFQHPAVKSVCVFDDAGMVLYLKKDEDGHCILREERE